jgi:hypothetical protein
VKPLAPLLLALAAGTAQAQHVEHAYLALSAGPSSVQTRCLNASSSNSSDSNNCGLSSSGGRALAGLFFQPGLAAEIVYLDFGRGRETRGADEQRVGLHALGLGTAAVMELGGGVAFAVRAGVAGTRIHRESTVALRRSEVVESSAELYGGVSGLFRFNRALAIEFSVDALGLGDSTYRRDGGAMASLGLSLRY